MIHVALRGVSLTALLAFGISTRAAAQAAPRPDAYAIQGVRIERGEEEKRATLLLKDGRIDAVLEPEAVLPHGVRVIDGAAFLALPAFVDAYSRAGCPTPARRRV
jgi:imidazolonepropionase-like amidohydrolase